MDRPPNQLEENQGVYVLKEARQLALLNQLQPDVVHPEGDLTVLHPKLAIAHLELAARKPQLIVVRIVECIADVLSNDPIQRLERRIGPSYQYLFVASIHSTVAIGDEVIHDVRFVLEEAVNGCGGILDFLGDLSHRDVLKTVFHEHFLSGFKHSLPEFSSLTLLAFGYSHDL
jgi:hypothetical protein